MTPPLRFAAIGLDHRHVYHLVGELIAAGAVCAGFCPQTSDAKVLEGFLERFPQLDPVDRERLFDDPSIDIVVCAAIPRDRAAIAIRAMQAGKDVMVDKPGAITADEVDEIDCVARETSRLYSICFSERFVVRACEVASRLVAEGQIGRVIQTVGLGPHRLNRAIRPDWFFDPAAYGGIITDIASHQIDQFLHFTGAPDATIVSASTANHNLREMPAFEDYGEVLLHGGGASGFIRVDWFTPDSLKAWGDGRLFLLGTEGYIELRKYIDIDGRAGGDHVFLSNRAGTRHIDASHEPLTYFRNFLNDVRDRTSTAMPAGHALKVTRLAIEAQEIARHRKGLVDGAAR
ncbi:Gfo/Idh/MocA family protein [Oryzicola mucosus]|uniref:Gfo/Idh/MocA family oxidoreductase n=1 Tax=Oryzicola mucosus TaxID=2767425 RepID=A0A8J6PQE5_9HYPH|nr:Gfo/Idh/MocA family oxidoreductase [Oryzicola mucosus]